MDDTLKILKMVEDGKITGEEASKLISALGKDKNDKKDEFFNIEKTNNGAKMLYIRVKSADGENVKVTIPIEVVKLAASLGNSTISGLEKYNIDFDMILKSIETDVVGPIVQVDTDEGDKVLIEIA